MRFLKLTRGKVLLTIILLVIFGIVYFVQGLSVPIKITSSCLPEFEPYPPVTPEAVLYYLVIILRGAKMPCGELAFPSYEIAQNIYYGLFVLVVLIFCYIFSCALLSGIYNLIWTRKRPKS